MYSEVKDIEKKPQLPPARDEPLPPPVYEVIPYVFSDNNEFPNDYEVSSDAKKTGTLVDENHSKKDENTMDSIKLQNGSKIKDDKVKIYHYI